MQELNRLVYVQAEEEEGVQNDPNDGDGAHGQACEATAGSSRRPPRLANFANFVIKPQGVLGRMIQQTADLGTPRRGPARPGTCGRSPPSHHGSEGGGLPAQPGSRQGSSSLSGRPQP